MKKFHVYNGLSLSQVNKDMLARWREADLFNRSVKERE